MGYVMVNDGCMFRLQPLDREILTPFFLGDLSEIFMLSDPTRLF